MTLQPINIDNFNPTKIASYILYNNQSTNITINTNFEYMVFAALKYTDKTSQSYASIYSIKNGIVSAISSGWSYGSVTLSGSTLTVKRTNSTLYTEFIIVKIT